MFIRCWAIGKSVTRIDTQLVAREDRAFLLRDCVNIERIQAVTAARHRENFKRPTEIQHFDFIKNKDGDISCVLCHGFFL